MEMNVDLQEYFTKYWPYTRGSGLEQYTYTGISLVDKINKGEKILDVGCGTNPFKPYFGDDILGIDITDIGSDVQSKIEDFESDEKFDVIFALGSINFGSEEVVRKQIAKMDSLLKPGGRIYWRCNPGLHDHQNPHVNEIDFFPWSSEYHNMFTKEFHYTVADYALDGTKRNRIYAEWQKI